MRHAYDMDVYIAPSGKPFLAYKRVFSIL